MPDSLIDIEGIGESNAMVLNEAGLKTTDDPLKSAGTAAGRKPLATQANISEAKILEWVNRADLMRIRGVGSEYGDLLEAAGVDTVVELATRVPANLQARLTEVNNQKNLGRRVPTASEVEAWVTEAKSLERMVSH